jgi:predicted secreted acid phosphatase
VTVLGWTGQDPHRARSSAAVNSVTSLPISGSLEFAKYAVSKGVRVFYISNRTTEKESAP